MPGKSWLRIGLIFALLLVGCSTSTVLITSTPAPSIMPSVTLIPPVTTAVIPSATFTITEIAPPTAFVTEVTPLPSGSVTPTASQTIRFAVIGDYGGGGSTEKDVADLVKSWQPDFVITVGDNNYPDGSSTTIDDHIGRFYHEYIYPYKGKYGQGADQIRFFPTLGNHDWLTSQAQPYLNYFTLPGNERYYDFSWGPVHFFALDSDTNEPDGVNQNSKQAKWLKNKLSGASEPWKIVYFHHAPYSSGLHGPSDWMQWPYTEWGASAVLAGHDHTYERLLIDGIPYFVDGVGGASIYHFVNIMDGSKVRYIGDYGAMLVAASPVEMTFQFINRKGKVIDTYSIQK
jgi:tartrate-resistant acid phosphatase type 5